MFRISHIHTTTLLLSLLLLLYLSSLSSAAAWIVYIFDGKNCDVTHIGTGAKTGSGSECIMHGGNSWQVEEGDDCTWTSWSGKNCRGSSHDLRWYDGCQKVPFGSVAVVCG